MSHTEGKTNGDPIGLDVAIKDGTLVISLPLSTLQLAVECYSDLALYDFETGDYLQPKVTDAALFAPEVVRALKHEGEDGSTLVTRMLDTAFTEAVENGAEGIQIPGEDYDEEGAPEGEENA